MKKEKVLQALVAVAVTAVVILGPSQALATTCLPTLTGAPYSYDLQQTNDPVAGTSHVTMAALSSAIPAGFGGFDPSATTSFGQDFTLGATVTWSSGTELGLAARANPSQMNFYYAGFNPINNYFALVQIVGGTEITNLDTANLAGVITSGQAWDITLTVDGSSLAATLSQGGSPLASLSYTDTQDAEYPGDPVFSDGQCGVFMFKKSLDTISGEWTNAYIVPEPATLGLLLLGALGIVARARKGRVL